MTAVWRDLPSAVAIIAAFALIFGFAEAWRLWRHPPVEFTRKFVHVASGVVAISLAWLIESPITLALLCAGFAIVLGVTQRLGLLQSVHAVARRSLGGVYYPLAIFATFWIGTSTGHPEFYVIAILVLAVSDSLASLVGSNYGVMTFLVQDDRKSVEGSLFFFITTFTIVHVALTLLTPLDDLACLLVAVYVAALVTALELICLAGADNFYVPVAVIAILLKITTKPVGEMLWQLGILTVDTAVVFAFVLSRKNVSASGAVGLALPAYAAHALIGPEWGYLVLAAIALYGLSGITAPRRQAAYRMQPTFYMSINVVFWILATNYFGFDPLVVFTAFAVNVIGILHLAWEYANSKAWSMRRPVLVLRLGVAGRAAALALSAAFGHAALVQGALPLIDASLLFVADLTLVAIGRHLLATPMSSLRRIQSTAAVAAAVSVTVALVSWRIYGHLF